MPDKPGAESGAQHRPVRFALGLSGAIATLLAGVAAIGSAPISSAAPSQTGLDPSFAGGGFTVLNLVAANNRANAVALDPSGRIVIAGRYRPTAEPSGPQRWLVGRVLANGDPDTAFDQDGWRAEVSRPCSGESCPIDGEAYALAIDGQSRAYVGGRDGRSFLLGRYTALGQRDSAFGDGGFVSGEFGSLEESEVRGVVTVPVDRVTAAIAVHPVGNPDVGTLVLGRWLAGGNSDPTFGDDGYAYEEQQDMVPSALLRQPDGQLIVVGTHDFGDSPGSTSQCVVARYKADAPQSEPKDPSFGTAGLTLFSFDQVEQYNACRAGVLQADGKVVVAGWNNERLAVARLTADGQLDYSFSGDGKFVVGPFGSSESFQAAGVGVDAFGRVLVGGTYYTAIGGAQVLIVRLLANGQPDTTFGPNGRLQTTLPPSSQQSTYGLAMQPDGKVVLAGGATYSGREAAFVLRFYNPGGGPTVTPWASPSWTPTATYSATATARPTYTPTTMPSATPSPTNTDESTATASATWTTEPTYTPSPSPTASPTSTASPTPTNTPTATTTPTSTPSPTATAALMVSGKVRLERRSSNAGAQVCVGVYCATTTADGSYSVGAVPGGKIVVRHPSYLFAEQTLPLTVTAEVRLPLVTLLSGDLNQDGKVEVDDAAMIGQRFNLRFVPGDANPQWLEACDITDDDVIDIRDMVGVQYNLRRAAPGPW